jgi:hypothetical protein
MDFELLNFWINKIGLDIHNDLDNGLYHPKLYLSLKAYKDDPVYTYALLLSENKNDILRYLGFDTTVEYDKLSEKNTFEYLCTSTKLDPKYIWYCGFKGPHAKNKLHSKFNEYLKDKNYPKGKDHVQINVLDAISFFGKESEYEEYKTKRALMDCIMQKKDILKQNGNDYNYSCFSRFITVYGIIPVTVMNDAELIEKWTEFKNQNWSCLTLFNK